jgi:alpha-glucosidase
MGESGPGPTPPSRAQDWWRGAVIYQIYPRSFRDADGDGVGDLKGVLEKLDYVASLGVDGVWLSPFFRSPMKDFGYDVSDYCDVDPLFGDLADFDAVLFKAHGLGLKLIIDQVWSHTSDKHAWFIESSASREGPKADWYVWADAKPDGTPPNNWQASFGGASWTWNPRRRQYYLHDFLSSQPDLNYWNPEVQEAILDVARFWLDRGVDGFRLDVINHVFHDRQLRDNPPADHTKTPTLTLNFQRHLYDKSRPEALAFLTRLRALTDRYDARMMVGEVFDEAALERQQDYTRPPDRLHTAYSFFLLYAPTATPELFAQALSSWSQAEGWPSWSLGNHDVDRFASRLAARGGRPQAQILLAVLICMRGTIFLYQGEELGLPQAHVPFDRLQDPVAIAAYTGGAGRDGARTPMPWTAEGPSAGFSAAAETWLPLDPVHRPLAAAIQEGDPASMLALTRRLIALRAASAALRAGEALVRSAPPGVLAFERSARGERLLCLFELAGSPASMAIDPEAEVIMSLNGSVTVQAGEVALPPFGGAILNLAPAAPPVRSEAS